MFIKNILATIVPEMGKNGFPLKIQEIMLGPLLSESKLNKLQIGQMLSEQGNRVAVNESERNVYR